MTTIGPTRRHTVAVGDATVSYAVDGAGPGLVLVHGAGGSADANWAHLVERFASDRTVVRPDYAGSGETRDHGDRLELDELVAQVAAAADDAGAAPFDLVGFSLGASVAASLAAQRPDLVRSLVLLGGFASTTADARSQVQFSLWRRLFDTDRDALARLGVLTGFSPAFLAGMTPTELGEAIAEGARTMPPGTGRQADLALRVDIAAQLASISAPTLVIGQTRDHIVPVERSRALHAAIPGASYAELDTGHLGLLEQPDLVAATIRKFLERSNTDMTERDPALEPFDALIGTWATEATHPLIDAVVPGSVTFEWFEGGRFLVQRSHNDHELFPDAICVLGAPEAGDGLVMEYFDSRGVRRTYGAALDDGVLRFWRDAPGFDQRFSATLGHDSFEGLWWLAEAPGGWQDDLKVTYRRRD